MCEERRLPPEGLVEPEVARRTGEPLLGPEHVADLHLVVVDHVGQVVCGEPVGLEQYEVVHQRVSRRRRGPLRCHRATWSRPPAWRTGPRSSRPRLLPAPSAQGSGRGNGGRTRCAACSGSVRPASAAGARGCSSTGTPSRRPTNERVAAWYRSSPLRLVVGGVAAANVRPLVPLDAEPPEGPRISSTAPSTFLAWSVSSMRTMNEPPVARASSQLKRAVRMLPRCGPPVGLGANLTLTFAERAIDLPPCGILGTGGWASPPGISSERSLTGSPTRAPPWRWECAMPNWASTICIVVSMLPLVRWPVSISLMMSRIVLTV